MIIYRPTRIVHIWQVIFPPPADRGSQTETVSRSLHRAGLRVPHEALASTFLISTQRAMMGPIPTPLSTRPAQHAARRVWYLLKHDRVLTGSAAGGKWSGGGVV